MEDTIPLHQVRNIVGTPSVRPKNRPFRNDPSLPDDYNRIGLNLEKWKNVHNEPYDTPTLAKARIDKILNFFINVATANDLTDTPAVQTLRESLSTLRRGGNFSRDAAKKNWRERITQLSEANIDHNPILRLRQLCLQGFPVFNIWDGISFIYTICADDVKTDLGAELHLYQFRMIIGALRDCVTYFAKFAGPTTVAASWKVGTQNQPLSVAFATTAVGERKDMSGKSKTRVGDRNNIDTREVMAAARQHFMSTITKSLEKESQISNTRSAPNWKGNCAEYLAWPVVCRHEGKYKSLCLNMAERWAYRCCGHCERTLQKLGANNVQIEDLWRTAHLSTTEGSEAEPYPYRELQKEEIIIQACKKLTGV